MQRSNIDRLIAELRSFTPFPDDDDEYISTLEGAKQLEKYQEIIRSLHMELQKADEDNVAPAILDRVIHELLESLNLGNGFGVYLEAIRLLETLGDILYPYVHLALTSSINPGTRVWCCYLLGRRRNKADLISLITALSDDNSHVRESSLQAIAMLAQSLQIREVAGPVSLLINDPDEVVAYQARDTLMIVEGLKNGQ